MIVVSDLNTLSDFKFYDLGLEKREEFLEEYGDVYDQQILEIIEEAFPDGIYDSVLNDIFGYELEYIKDSLGINKY